MGGLLTRKNIKKTAFSTFLALSVALGGFFAFNNPINVYAQERPSQYEVEIPSLVNGNQGSTGLCWAYVSTKVLESYYYTNTEPHQTINISENWISLAYMYYVNDPNQSITDRDNADYVWGTTGQARYYQHAINAYGFVEEDDWTLTQTVTKDNYKTLFEDSLQFAQKDIFANLEFDWLGYKVISDYSYNNYNIILSIKDLLLKDNMVYSAAEVNNLVIKQNAEGLNYLYYEDVTTKPGHAITIVGFDDNFQAVENGETLTGAFKILNSYGADGTGGRVQYFYVPYKMFESSLVNNTEQNKLFSNAYYLKSVDITPPSLDDGNPEGPGGSTTPENPDGNDPVNPPSGEEPEPGNPNTPPSGDGDDPETPPNDNEDDPIIPPGGGEDPETPPSGDEQDPVTPPSGDENEDVTTEIPNFIDVFNQKTTAEKVVVLFGVSAGVIFTGTAIGFGVAAGIRRARTNALNHHVMAKTLSDYQSHKFDLQKKEKELQEQLEELRKVQERKKQRRLKRKFYDNIDKKS